MFSTKQECMDEFSGDDLALVAWSRLIRVAQRVARSGSEQLRAHGLTPAQFQLLRRIAQQPDQTQQALVEHLDVTRGNVSQLVDKLEEEGLVARVQQGNTNLLRLTEAGSRLVATLRPAHDQFITGQFSVLSRDEQQQLVRLLTKLDRGL
jgi:DNA-binding MarR family transcriptional regulator